MESGDKKVLKEKVVLLYDEILRGLEPYGRTAHFWDDFFLLWPNTASLEQKLLSSEYDLLQLKSIINDFVHNCVLTVKEDQGIRAVNALQTLGIMIRTVVKRTAFGFDIIDFLFGFNEAENIMQVLTDRVCEFIGGDYAPTLKSLSLHLLLTITTAVDNVNENTVLEYFLLNSVFEAVIQLLSTSSERGTHGRDALLVLTLLGNYRKYENVNQYIAKLSILDNELALNGYSHTVSSSLSQQNKAFFEHIESTQATSVFTSFTNMVDNVEPDLAMLLSLYEAVHLNRNFITTLTTAPAAANGSTVQNSTTPSDVQQPLQMDLSDLTCSTNLLTSFLTYSSIMQQHLKSERCDNAARLCAIILTCISEDQYANTLMHDVNMTFKVPLFRAPMRHRKGFLDKSITSRPLACTVLDLCIEFILSHMMRNFPFDLYMRMLGVVHRILCFEKKCRVRLDYSWRTLWNALICLLKFVVAQESYLLQAKIDLFAVCQRVLTILNLFVTYGDTFLPNPSSYDELYYEIIRNADAFGSLYSLLLRHGSGDSLVKETATKLCGGMVNIRAIIIHFQPKIDELHTSTLTEQEIMDIVRRNYDTLTLKLQENLDSYERYQEQPKEASFFTNIVKAVVANTRAKLRKIHFDHQTVLRDLSTIK